MTASTLPAPWFQSDPEQLVTTYLRQRKRRRLLKILLCLVLLPPLSVVGLRVNDEIAWAIFMHKLEKEWDCKTFKTPMFPDPRDPEYQDPFLRTSYFVTLKCRHRAISI